MVWTIWGGGSNVPVAHPLVADLTCTKENAFYFQHTKRDEASETPFESIAKLCNKPLKM